MDTLDLKGNESHFDLIIDDTFYDVVSYSLQDFGLNSLYTLSLQVSSDHQVNTAALLKQSACFRIRQDTIFSLHGDITEIIELSPSSHFNYTIVIEPSLQRLRHEEKTDYFTNQSLHSLILTLLKSHYIFDVHCDFSNQVHPFQLQYQDSDLSLFYALILQYGLVFYFEQSKDFTRLVITDRIPKGRVKKLNIVDTDALAKPLYCAFNKITTHFLLPDSLILHTQHAYHLNQSYQRTCQNQTSIKGLGQHHVYLPYACYSQKDCDFYAKHFQNGLDWQRSLTQFKSTLTSFAPGDRIIFDNKSDNVFLVLNVQSNGSEENTNRHPATSTVILSNIETGFCSPHPLFSVERPQIHLKDFLNKDDSLPPIFSVPYIALTPRLLTARIASSESKPPINPDGRYPVILDCNNKKRTPPLLLLHNCVNPPNKPYFGIRFQLYANTRVIVGFINDSSQRPFILGACCEEKEESLINNQNPNENRIQGATGLGLCLNDQERTLSLYSSNAISNISIQTKVGQEALVFEAQKGEIQYQALKNIQIKSTGTANYHSDTLSFSIAKDYLLAAESYTVTANNCYLEIKGMCLSESKKIHFEGSQFIHSQTGIDYESELAQSIQTAIIKSDSIDSALLRGLDSLLIECQGVKIKFTQSGRILIKGNTRIQSASHKLSPTCTVIKSQ
jgi:hypothetical protein